MGTHDICDCMKRFFLFIPLMFLSILSFGASNVPDSVEVRIKILFDFIEKSDVRIKEKEERLRDLTIALDTVKSDPMQKYRSFLRIADEYNGFIADSSILYYEKALDIAKRLGRKDLATKVKICQSKTMISTGYFFEAQRLLSDIEKHDVPEDAIEGYYTALTSLYYATCQHNIVPASMYDEFKEKYESYRDSLLSVIRPDSPYALRYMERMAAQEGRMNEAFEYNDRRRVVLGSRLNTNALVFYDKYVLICHYQGRPIEEGISDLLTSAIIDVSVLNQDIASPLPLEQYLCTHNMFKEAKKISDYYYSTMIRYGSKARRENAFKQSMEIYNNYVDILTRNRLVLVAALSVVSILIVALIAVLLYVLSARHKLSFLNDKLAKSDKLSKTYMTHFFQLYSAYVDSMSEFRHKISTMLHRGRVEDVIRLAAPSKENEWEEIRGLMNNFDSAFLSVYPDYIKEFNSMLKEECRITPKPNEIMTIELRIFALIKMGVEDSGEIANALHISIKTVYNKRSEIKSKLAIPYEDFLKNLGEI